MIRCFFKTALWLLKQYPSNCPREFFAGWLLRCVCKNGESETEEKRKLVEKVLSFLELSKRAVFEEHLCLFITTYNLKMSKRERLVSQDKISGQVEWAQTICENMMSSPGSLIRFIARPIKRVPDPDVLLVLKNIALELQQNLEFFADLLQTHEYDERIRKLKTCAANTGSFCRIYDENTSWKLRQTPEGRELAAEIEKWHNHSFVNLSEHIDDAQSEYQYLNQLLSIITGNLEFNENDLLEGISIVQSAKALTEKDFRIVECTLNTKKPELTLQRKGKNNVVQQVKIAKNIPEFSNMDKTKAYRTVGNKPSGLQPDIIYECSSADHTFYLLGDAKNYVKSDFGPALYAMLHYLLAFSKELKLPADFFNPEKENFLQVSDYKRIVLFFPEEKKADIDEKHPVQLVFGENLDKLSDFFQSAFEQFESKG